ncbi:MAG: adenylate/guanylate cyclase domain-containing protein, partial [Anaerolineales bacterium]|nr:adenylate/guanylate cyclase domain-containing protein [Anaerolineales bacterium]
GQEWLLETLGAVRADAGSLPRMVPKRLRWRIGIAQIATSMWQDGGGLSWSRIIMGLIIGGLVSLLMTFGILGRLDEQMLDSYFAPYPTSGIVTIVEVNDASLERYGRWDAWPRALHAQLIDQLSAAGAKAIVFDILFDAPTADDAALVAAMQQAGNIVQPVLGQGDAIRDELGVVRFEQRILPEADVRAVITGMGHTNILHDNDGYVRQIPAIISVGDEWYPSLALAAIQTYLTDRVDMQNLPQVEDGRLFYAGRSIPVGEFGEIRVYYSNPPAQPGDNAFTTVSYQNVLDGSVPAELFKDKIVLIGITATAEPDRYLTPVSSGRPMYGVEIMANLIESVWSGRFVVRPSSLALVVILLVLGVLTGLVSYRPWSGLAFALGLGALYYLAASLLFDARAVMLDLLYPFATIALTYATVTTYRFSTEVRLRREVMRLFASNVTPQVAEATLEAVRRGELNLEGQAQEITALFVDIRGYGRFAGVVEPALVVELANRFKDMVTETALQFDGTMANVEGEQMMIIFNAPLQQTDHIWRAIQTSSTLRARIDEFVQSVAEDDPAREIGFGCGIYSGRAIVGSSGTSRRTIYTAFGDTVSIAAQLAVQAKMGQIMIGDKVYQQIKDRVRVEEIPPMFLRERSLPLTVYVLLGEANH